MRLIINTVSSSDYHDNNHGDHYVQGHSEHRVSNCSNVAQQGPVTVLTSLVIAARIDALHRLTEERGEKRREKAEMEREKRTERERE